MLNTIRVILIVFDELCPYVFPSYICWVKGTLAAMVLPPKLCWLLKLEAAHHCLVFIGGMGEVKVVVHLLKPTFNCFPTLSPSRLQYPGWDLRSTALTSLLTGVTAIWAELKLPLWPDLLGILISLHNHKVKLIRNIAIGNLCCKYMPVVSVSIITRRLLKKMMYNQNNQWYI